MRAVIRSASTNASPGITKPIRILRSFSTDRPDRHRAIDTPKVPYEVLVSLSPSQRLPTASSPCPARAHALATGENFTIPPILLLDRRAIDEAVELQERFGRMPYKLNSSYNFPKLYWLSKYDVGVLEKSRTNLDQIHPKSPLYDTAQQRIGNLIDKYDLKYGLSDFSYVEKRGDFQLARVSQSIKKISGPKFRDRILDGIWTFRKSGESWKLWFQATLKKSFL